MGNKLARPKCMDQDLQNDIRKTNELLQQLITQGHTVQTAGTTLEVFRQRLRDQHSGKVPTAREIERSRKKLGFREGYFHFAVAGSTGCGKSSLVNAMRGKSDWESGSARIGITETTKKITRYPDDSWFTGGKFVWYDIPGGDTLDLPAEEYFNVQGLYNFDAIIVAVDRQISPLTIAIIQNCILWGIPWYLVRSKADQHIDDLVGQLNAQANEGDNVDSAMASQRRIEAQNTLIEETSTRWIKVLADLGIPSVKSYIISSSNLRRTVQIRRPTECDINEWSLIQDLIQDVFENGNIKTGQRREYHGLRH